MDSIRFQAMDIPVLYEAEVAVIGGGSAGSAAAIAAARGGAKTVLLEKTGVFGGINTIGLLPSIIHMSDGVNIVADGLCRELVDETAARMGCEPSYHWQNVQPEILKSVYDEMVEAAGVKIYLSIHACSVIANDGVIQAIVVSTPNGLKAVKAGYFIDATGDGHISAWAGAPYEVGDEDGYTMAPTLCQMQAGIAFPSDDITVNAKGKTYWDEALANGSAPTDEHHFVGMFRNSPTTGCGNLGHIYNRSCLDEDDLTFCYLEGRRLAKVYHQFFKDNIPGYENSELVATGGILGIRETRRIIGEYVMTMDDFIALRSFPDEIGRYAYPIDIHAAKADPAAQVEVLTRLNSTRLKPGENYGVSYRALLPLKTVNLLVAGRCISSDRAIQSSIRTVPGCFITGQAAGTAAALAVETDTSLRSIDTGQLRKNLRKLGAWLPENC